MRDVTAAMFFLCAAGCAPAGSCGAPGRGAASRAGLASSATAAPAGAAASALDGGASAPPSAVAPPKVAEVRGDGGSGGEPQIAPGEAEEILFPDDAGARRADLEACRDRAPDGPERIRCLLEARFRSDREALALALAIYDESASVAGVEREHVMDGGYRGALHLVPELPIRASRNHLSWTLAALADYQAFFRGLAPLAAQPIRYRSRALALRYFRSVRARTPSAYAVGWTVAYNLAGSLNVSAEAVRETLFHEIFHLNDGAHGTWSAVALGALYDRLVARCGTRIACLKPYAPNGTLVKGGTYYAFQPGNGVGEYAAELAIRYYREQRTLLRGERLTAPAFKCGPPENGEAWAALVAEFFGGADRVPPCAPPSAGASPPR